jgi:signal transduction histidine kinase
MFGTWAGANIALLCTLFLSRALGYADSVSYAALRLFGIGLLAALPLGIVFELWRKMRSLAAFATFSAGCLCLVRAGVEAATGFALPAMPELLLSLCTGWLVFQEGYPERSAWNRSLPALTRKEGMILSMHARLLDAENALIGQERIATAGFLALGAAHEFKNILSLVRLAATHGLGREGPQEKDACLRLIVEHTRTARDSAIEVLERLSTEEGEEARTLEAARDLTETVRRAGAGLRAEGIVIEMDFGTGIAFRARRSDVERIIVNLIHNAAECYRKSPSEKTRIISIHARTEDECAVIEVRDAAGGVDEGIRHELFSPSHSGGSGLGLYLSRNLALANQGSLDYRPIEGGSAFILALPAVFNADESLP